MNWNADASGLMVTFGLETYRNVAEGMVVPLTLAAIEPGESVTS